MGAVAGLRDMSSETVSALVMDDRMVGCAYIQAFCVVLGESVGGEAEFGTVVLEISSESMASCDGDNDWSDMGVSVEKSTGALTATSDVGGESSRMVDS